MRNCALKSKSLPEDVAEKEAYCQLAEENVVPKPESIKAKVLSNLIDKCKATDITDNLKAKCNALKAQNNERIGTKEQVANELTKIQEAKGGSGGSEETGSFLAKIYAHPWIAGCVTLAAAAATTVCGFWYWNVRNSASSAINTDSAETGSNNFDAGRSKAKDHEATASSSQAPTAPDNSGGNGWVIFAIVATVIVLLASILVYFMFIKKSDSSDESEYDLEAPELHVSVPELADPAENI